MKFEERAAREIFRFEKPGDSLNGVLVEIDLVEIKGKPTLRYTINDPEEQRTFSVLGTMAKGRGADHEAQHFKPLRKRIASLCRPNIRESENLDY